MNVRTEEEEIGESLFAAAHLMIPFSEHDDLDETKPPLGGNRWLGIWEFINSSI